MANEEKDTVLEQQPEADTQSEAADTAPETDTAPEKEETSSEETPNTEAAQPDPRDHDPRDDRIKELEDQLLRKMAEFDNYRRRTTREKEEIGQTARMKCVGELLPVLDNFERAMQVGCTDENFLKGVKMILDNMVAAFTKMGVEEIPAEGQVFDPELHYAVSRVENPDLGANTVAAVMQKGYRMGDKVIRHAMVAVANAD